MIQRRQSSAKPPRPEPGAKAPRRVRYERWMLAAAGAEWMLCRREAVVLLSVLVVIVLLTLAAYQFSELMMAEYKASVSYTKTLQTKALADSGVAYTAAALADQNAFAALLNSNPFDNPTAFQDVPVPGDPNAPQGKFSIITLADPYDVQNNGAQPWRYGVTDESGKINLNALLLLDNTGNIAQQILTNLQQQLPNLTDDVIDSILDWLDPDETPRANGAESDYYGSLNPPYQSKNGPLDSLEELLLVKGVTAQVLFGNDRNRNGILDPGEDDGTGQVNPGLAAYVTVYSREPNVNNSGTPRIYLNDADLNTLNANLTPALGPDLTNFILAYRLYGPGGGNSGGGGNTPQPTTPSKPATTPATAGNKGTTDPDTTGAKTPAPTAPSTGTGASKTPTGSSNNSGAGSSGTPQKLSNSDNQSFQDQLAKDLQSSSNRRLTPISSLFALVNAKVSVQTGSGATAKTITVPSPLSDPGQQTTLLPLLLDQTTTSKASDLPARINLNTASQTVLSALPWLQNADVQTILSTRPDPTSMTAPDPIFQTPAWLLTEANLSVSTLQSMEPYITARSSIYRFQVVGYYDNNGPATRIEAVVDTNFGRPRVIYYRDLTSLGKGFDLGGNGNNQ